MLLIKSIILGSLVMGNVFLKVAIYNQPLDEISKCFAVASVIPHILDVVTVRGCIMPLY